MELIEGPSTPKRIRGPQFLLQILIRLDIRSK